MSLDVFSNYAIEMLDFDPGGVNPVDVKWVDLQGFDAFSVIAMKSVGTGAVDTFKILANSQSDGSGTDVVVKTHALGTPVDAVGDFVVLHARAIEVADAAANAGVTGVRYVSAQLELAVGTDEMVVTYLRGPANVGKLNLTQDTIA